MTDDDYLRAVFRHHRDGLADAIRALRPTDGDAALEEAADQFEALLPTIPYRDRADHSMASSAHACAAYLALYLALRSRGVDAHVFGNLILTHPSPLLPTELVRAQPSMERLRTDATESQNAAPGEFRWEMVAGDGNFHWGLNIQSCAICHMFRPADAMDLVPYMCALDDVMSDAGEQGLRRTGSIGVGAHQCDFRYTQGAPGLALKDQYPERIQVQTL